MAFTKKNLPRELRIMSADNGFIVMPDKSDMGRTVSLTEEMHVFNSRTELGAFIKRWADQVNEQIHPIEDQENVYE